FRKLIQRFQTAARALERLPGVVRECGWDTERFRLCTVAEAEAELEGLERIGGHLLLLADAAYPERLRRTDDPPPVLSVRGDPTLLAQPSVALVGARNASGNGRAFAERLARELTGEGLVVVSGLARGIDTAAHQGALEGGATVAVVASGIDVAYPPENARLMERIAADGAVVSERPLGREPQARHFPRRNRMIAGLSLGVVVVEAAPKSGSLITARLAAEQGREVMAVPGSPLDPRHRGTNRLLRDGATLVEDAAEVMDALRSQIDARLPRPAPEPPVVQRREVEQRAVRSPLAVAAGDDLPVRSRIRTRLGPEPLLVDELIRQCDASSAEVQQALIELELEGRIERHPGNRVSLASA
ncbi:MAG: DNA-processing protein DprA, partial [Geminicoccaceae bacterium]|nr:DNA-processing protein DprA [Geminicoccaceae bacterium]